MIAVLPLNVQLACPAQILCIQIDTWLQGRDVGEALPGMTGLKHPPIKSFKGTVRNAEAACLDRTGYARASKDLSKRVLVC